MAAIPREEAPKQQAQNVPGLSPPAPHRIDAPTRAGCGFNYETEKLTIVSCSESANTSSNAPNAPSDNREPRFNPQPAVRFKSAVEEIAPTAREPSYATSGMAESPEESGEPGEPADDTADQLRALSKSLRGCHLQEQRMNIFSYQPYSLPASRVRFYCPPPSSNARLILSVCATRNASRCVDTIPCSDFFLEDSFLFQPFGLKSTKID